MLPSVTMPPSVPTAFLERVEADITMLEEVPLLFCKACRQCLWADEVRSHMKNEGLHGPFNAHESAVAEQVSAQLWPAALKNPTSPIHLPSLIRFPTPPLARLVVHLPTESEPTFGCACCHLVYLSVGSLDKHFKTQHPDESGPRFDRNVAFQRLFPSRKLSQRFRVTVPPDVAGTARAGATEAAERFDAFFKRSLEESRTFAAAHDKTIRHSEHDQLPPFLRRAKFEKLFTGYDRDLLRAHGALPPSKSDSPESLLVGTVRQMALKIGASTREATEVITFAMAANSTGPSTEPFEVPYLNSTVARYGDTLGRAMLFLMRAESVGEERPLFTLTPAQSSALSALRGELSAARKEHGAQDGEQELEEESSKTKAEEVSRTPPRTRVSR
jgi:hypothetical protein